MCSRTVTGTSTGSSSPQVEALPRCPVCGRPMAMNLRANNTFVEDAGWHRAAEQYEDFARRHQGRKLLLELGLGWNTPVFCSLCAGENREKITVKQQVSEGSHSNDTREYEERRYV